MDSLLDGERQGAGAAPIEGARQAQAEARLGECGVTRRNQHHYYELVFTGCACGTGRPCGVVVSFFGRRNGQVGRPSAQGAGW